MKSSKLTKALCHLALPSIIVAGGVLTSCEDDLLTGTPSWLGSSIYAELEERGNFTQELALINDPCFPTDPVTGESMYKKYLRLTGSKTLFVADDAAWARFYQTNRWGARQMSELTPAQKKMLLKSSMIDNAYLIELLSNRAGSPPEKGGCVRRVSSASLNDSLPVVLTKDLPNTPQWAHLRATKEKVYLYPAMNMGDVPPMLHFLPDYMKLNNFTNEDVSVITNGVLTTTNGSFVNGQLVRENSGESINRDITCQNGYIHIVEGVPYQLENMAELIASKPQFSLFSSILDRYSTPVGVGLYDNPDGTQDSVYVKRYFNTGGSQSQYITSSTDAQPITSLDALNFDPGWNNYVLNNNQNITYESDAGCILVPTNDALEAYGRGKGKALLDRFHTWDSIPIDVINKLVKNQMKSSMNLLVPSKFYAVTNNAGDALGLTREAVDSCFVACNGLVYQVNRVFDVPEYEAVSFPTQHDTTLSVSKFAAESNNPLLNFNAYLTSTGSKYGFLIPTDGAYKHYINPTAYAAIDTTKKKEEWAFSIKGSGKTKSLQVVVSTTDLKTGKVTTKTSSPTGTSDPIYYALRDIMQNHIIVLDENLFTDQQKIYTNMAGGPVRVENMNSWSQIGNETTHQIRVAGSKLMEEEGDMDVDLVYVMGNGISMTIKDSPLMTTGTTPYDALKNDSVHGEYQAFFELVKGSNLKQEKLNKKSCLSMGMTMFNNYHYTMYVPSSASINRLHDKGVLPTWNDVEVLRDFSNQKTRPDEGTPEYDAAVQRMSEMEDFYGFKLPMITDSSNGEVTYDDKAMLHIADSLARRIEDFVTYHIQDNALYLDGARQNNMSYETSCLDPLVTNEDGDVISGTGRYRKLMVNYDYNNMTVTPVWSIVDANGKTWTEVKTQYARTVKPGVNSNVVTRQYVYDSESDAKQAKYVYSSSYVVIHEIDGPLFYDEALTK